MNPDLLFLHRIDQIRILSESNKETELVDLAGRLRQVFFDKKSLVESVNRGLKLTFDVGDFPKGWGPNDDPHWDKVVYQSLQDGIDPHTSHQPITKTLTQNQFGQHVIAFVSGTKITVKDIVRYNANVKGGIHFDPILKPEYQKFATLESLHLGGIASSTRELKAITRVTLRGLEPLVKSVASRAT